MPEPLLREIVPSDYHEAPYLKDWLDKPQKEAMPEIFKKLHHAQGLVGKKTVGLPAGDATDDEWSKFFGSMKPSSTDEYKIPTGKEGKGDPAFAKILQMAFHEGGVHPKQANAFMAKFSKELEGYTAAQAKIKTDQETKAAEAFEELAKASLGEKSKAITARVRAEMQERAPAALKPYIDKLDDKALIIMTGVINSVMEEYMPEDKLNLTGGAGGDGGKSKREEARALNEKLAKMTGFESDYKDVQTRVSKLYEEAAAEQAAAGK